MGKQEKLAIKSLQRHRDKIQNNPNSFDRVWVSKLGDILNKYLGADSLLYKSTTTWYSFVERGNTRHMNDCLNILNNSIEYIEDNGILKDKSFWRTLENANKSVVVTIIIFIINLIFWTGYFYGDYKQTKLEFVLSQENKSLRDSLFTIQKTLNVTNEETSKDTTANSQGNENEMPAANKR